MVWAIFYRRSGKNILHVFKETNDAVKLLLWCKQMRLPQHVMYGVDEFKEGPEWMVY